MISSPSRREAGRTPILRIMKLIPKLLLVLLLLVSTTIRSSTCHAAKFPAPPYDSSTRNSAASIFLHGSSKRPGPSARILPTSSTTRPKSPRSLASTTLLLRGGAFRVIPAGWNPLGYKITALGEEFLSFEGALDCDVGRFLASLKAGRRRVKDLKASWLEIVRASKTGQAMRIYRNMDHFITFCLKAGFIN